MSPRPLTALVVMASERSCDLISCLTKVAARVLSASSCAEAAEFLYAEPAVGIVLTDLTLPDGSWCDVMTKVLDVRPNAAVVVCSRLADERLWAEVLDAGGFDVLAEPYGENDLELLITRAVMARPSRLAAVV